MLCFGFLLFAQEPSDYPNPYHETLGEREEVIFSPLDGSIMVFGNLKVNKEGLMGWDTGQKTKFKVLKYDKKNIIIEFNSSSLPVFNDQIYKFIKFELVAMDEIEINFYKAMYIVNFCATEKDLEQHSNLWGIYLLSFPNDN